MSSTDFTPTSSRSNSNSCHSHKLSVNSISSIPEPATPPSVGSNVKSYLWDSQKSNDNLTVPIFSLELNHDSKYTHYRNVSIDSASSDKENKASPHLYQDRASTGKIDKEFLISLNRVPLAHLRGEILRLAKDQHGCRFLQKRIDDTFVPNASSRKTNFDIIYEQVKGSLYELIIDPFGNYLIQKLTEYLQVSDLDFCLESLSGNMFSISINQHGTRAIQKVIDKISTEAQYNLLVKALKPYIIELIRDLNGNHVIQRVLNKYSPEKCQFIYDSILRDLLTIATHKHGCCVLQKCLNHVTSEQHKSFAEVILNFNTFTSLVNDQFGNYVLQYLISINSIDVNCQLYRNIFEYGLHDLCVLKFSSNVIEKLMTSCYKNEVQSIAFSNLKFAMIANLFEGNLDMLVNNAYGNYVVQTLTDILINPRAVYFVDSQIGDRRILPSLAHLLDRNFQSSPDTLQVQIIKKWFQDCRIESTYGKKIQSKINNIMNGSGKKYQRNANAISSLPLQLARGTETNQAGEMIYNSHRLAFKEECYPRSTDGLFHQQQRMMSDYFRAAEMSDSHGILDPNILQYGPLPNASRVEAPCQHFYPALKDDTYSSPQTHAHSITQQGSRNVRHASNLLSSQISQPGFDPANFAELSTGSRSDKLETQSTKQTAFLLHKSPYKNTHTKVSDPFLPQN